MSPIPAALPPCSAGSNVCYQGTCEDHPFRGDGVASGAFAYPALCQTRSDMRRLICTIGLPVLVFILATGCKSERATSRTISSPVVPFGELFTVADTVRLDPSVVIGSVSVLDVNEQGEVLVSDHVGRGIHRFSPSGAYVRSYAKANCLPDEGNLMPGISRFIGNGRVMTIVPGGAAAVFEENGSCAEATRRLEAYSKAFCASRDFIFMHRVYVEGKATMGVYSPALEAMDDLEIEPPRLVRLNQFFGGLVGTSVACFEDGPYYIYAESMDGIAARPRSSTTRYQPEYFERRPDELPVADAPAARGGQRNDYPSTVSIFALDGLTRMVVSVRLDEKWRPDDSSATPSIGLSLASNAGRFPGRSTISPVTPRAAGNGYFYATGNSEELPGGEFGNPLIIRYRFTLPDDSRE